MAARVDRLPPRRVESNPKTTPLDMLNVKVGELETSARPFALTTDHKTSEQYPSRAVTTCPHCGHGIEFDIRLDLLLGHLPLTASCDNCGAGKVTPPEPLEDPFRNPLVEGVITRPELDPLYSDPAALTTSPKTTAADRVQDRRKKPAKSNQKTSGKPVAATGTGAVAQKPVAATEAQDGATERHDEVVDEAAGIGPDALPDDLEDILGNGGPDTPPEDPVDVLGDGALEMGEEPDEDTVKD